MTLRGRRVSYEMQVRDGHTSRAAWGMSDQDKNT